MGRDERSPSHRKHSSSSRRRYGRSPVRSHNRSSSRRNRSKSQHNHRTDHNNRSDHGDRSDHSNKSEYRDRNEDRERRRPYSVRRGRRSDSRSYSPQTRRSKHEAEKLQHKDSKNLQQKDSANLQGKSENSREKKSEPKSDTGKNEKTELDQKKLDRLNRFKKLAETRLKSDLGKKSVSIKLTPAGTKSEKRFVSPFQGLYEIPEEPQPQETEQDTTDIDPLDQFMSNLTQDDSNHFDFSKVATLEDVLMWANPFHTDDPQSNTVPQHTDDPQDNSGHINNVNTVNNTVDKSVENAVGNSVENSVDEDDEFLLRLKDKIRSDVRIEEDFERCFSDDEYDPTKVSMGGPDYMELLPKIRGGKKELPRVDHSKIDYLPFRKNFYVQVSSITNMGEHEVDAFRKANGNIRVYGKKCPRPISSFSQCGLPDPILKILEKREYEKPFPIQMQCIPALMCGRDVIGIAETGSGKTLAFLLPGIRHVLDQPPLRESDGMIVLIIAPTRELVIQISNECAKFSKSVGLRTLAVYGGAGIGEQLNALKRGAEIVVGTPGRLIDVLTLSKGKVTNLRRVTYLVLDEADRMFDMGFAPQISAIVGNIRPDRQTALFSATFPLMIENLAKKILVKPLQIVVGQRGKSASQVDQHVVVLNDDKKLLKLLKLLGEWHEHGNIIIFVNTQLESEHLFNDLLAYGYEAGILHGGVDQTDREFTLNDFREGKKTILIATSIAARGIDVKSVVLVINYAAPDHFEDYVHRVGRTGRAGTIGTSYTFLTPEEAAKSHDIIKALRLASQEVPKELLQLSQAHLATMDGKLSRGRGFGGKGFKFTESEQSRQQQERKRAIKLLGMLEGEEGEEEEGTEDSLPQKVCWIEIIIFRPWPHYKPPKKSPNNSINPSYYY
eukprot:XP_763560.1 ATP-dependent RNA helicase [Theileria parva strain Muguga]